jgi:hypothetical protein
VAIHNPQHTFSSSGPYADWDYIGQISASIPCQRKVKDHIENSINHFRRYKSHTSPEDEEDINCLQASYRASQIHVKKPGRKLESEDIIPDTVRRGSDTERLAKLLENWAGNRVSERSTSEDWTDY